MTDGIDQETVMADAQGPLDPRSEAEAATAGDAPAVEEPIDELEALRRELGAAQEKAADSQDKYLRALAEMENNKKRVDRLYQERLENEKKRLLTQVLAVKDNLERALHYGESSNANGEGIIEGVRLTQYQLESLLSQEGVEPIEAEGKPFDPRLEEAVQSVDDRSVPDHAVVQVVRTGYTYQGNVLRPAQVVVSVHQADKDDAKEDVDGSGE